MKYCACLLFRIIQVEPSEWLVCLQCVYNGLFSFDFNFVNNDLRLLGDKLLTYFSYNFITQINFSKWFVELQPLCDCLCPFVSNFVTSDDKVNDLSFCVHDWWKLWMPRPVSEAFTFSASPMNCPPLLPILFSK